MYYTIITQQIMLRASNNMRLTAPSGGLTEFNSAAFILQILINQFDSMVNRERGKI
jgi:hypothetical protein